MSNFSDSCNDSSLPDQHRQLKRARLADGLNERLSQKSGTLELVKVNILHADEILAQAVRGKSRIFSKIAKHKLFSIIYI